MNPLLLGSMSFPKKAHLEKEVEGVFKKTFLTRQCKQPFPKRDGLPNPSEQRFCQHYPQRHKNTFLGKRTFTIDHVLF